MMMMMAAQMQNMQSASAVADTEAAAKEAQPDGTANTADDGN